MDEFQITDLKAQATSDSITIEWEVKTKIPADKLSYEAVLYGDDGTYLVSDHLQDMYAHTFSNLKANMEYLVFARAYEEPGNKFIVEYPAEGKSVTTLDEEPAKVLPKFKVAEEICDDGFRIRRMNNLGDESEPYTDYKVYIRKKGDKEATWEIAEHTRKKSSIWVMGLESGTSYEFYVEVTDEAGHILRSPSGDEVIPVTTRDALPPAIVKTTKLEARDLTCDGFTILLARAQNPVKGRAIFYCFSIKEAGEDEWLSDDDHVRIASHRFENLKTDTTYIVRVFGWNHDKMHTLHFEDLEVRTLSDQIQTVLSKPEEVHCDGLYHGGDKDFDYQITSFYENLGQAFDRRYFELSFDYYPTKPTEKSWNGTTNILTLDTYYRALGILGDGKIRIETNNGRNVFQTNIPSKQGKWQHIDLVHDDGRITINGKVLQIGTVHGPGDNVLSSVDFSDGNSFSGKIKNLVVNSKATMDLPIIFSRRVTINCNGIYANGDVIALEDNLGSKLDRERFDISFEFNSDVWGKDSSENDHIISLVSNHGALRLFMTEDSVFVTKDDGVHVFDSGIRFKLDEWQEIDMSFNNGLLTINGKVIELGPLDWDSNETELSSLNHFNRHSFKGCIRRLTVRSR